MKSHHKIVDGDQRILDPDQFGQLGQILNLVANYDASGGSIGVNKDPNTILVQRVQPSEVGLTRITRDLKGRKLNATNQYAPQMITMAIEATMTHPGESNNEGEVQDTILQGVLRFGTGMANQGTQSSTPLAFANISLDPRIRFDIAEGAMLSFPTAYFELDFLITSVTTISTGFNPAGKPASPSYQVVYSLGYEQQGNSDVTMTQLHPARDLASGGGGGTFFFRPKFSTSVYFTWFNWTKTGSPVLDVTFYNAQGNGIWHINDYPGGALPPTAIPWPPEAVAVKAEQSSGTPYAWFRCISVLEF